MIVAMTVCVKQNSCFTSNAHKKVVTILISLDLSVNCPTPQWCLVLTFRVPIVFVLRSLMILQVFFDPLPNSPQPSSKWSNLNDYLGGGKRLGWSHLMFSSRPPAEVFRLFHQIVAHLIGEHRKPVNIRARLSTGRRNSELRKFERVKSTTQEDQGKGRQSPVQKILPQERASSSRGYISPASPVQEEKEQTKNRVM